MKVNRYKFFTLVELIVVIAVLSILISLLSPKLKSLGEFSQLNQCKNQLRFVFTATELYISDNEGVLPGPLMMGQLPYFQMGSLASFIHPYLNPVKRSDRNGYVLNEMICPSNHQDNSSLASDRRLHFRTHLSPNSTSYFGYPGNSSSYGYYTIPNPSEFKILRDLSKAEFNKNSLPGWSSLLSEASPHFGTDVNTLYFDGHVDQEIIIQK